MSPRFRLAILIGVALFGAQACGDSASTSMNVTAPAGVRCQATVTNNASSFAAAGGPGSVTVSVSRECSWSAVSRSPWLTITAGQEGQGDGTVAYRVDENSAPVARQATLVISDREVAIGQAAAPCRFEVRADEGPVPPQGGDLRVELGTHELCDWAASSEVAWASVTPGAGRGSAAVQVSVTANSGVSRPVSVVVANQRISVTQAALPAPPPTPTPTPTPAPAPAPAPTPVRRVEIEGRISDFSGSCPAVTFTIGGQQVYTTSQTRYDDGRCSSLRNGREVEIEGTLMSDGRIRADEVEIDD